MFYETVSKTVQDTEKKIQDDIVCIVLNLHKIWY